MIRINFNSLEEAVECYGRENLIPIENIKQTLFYVKHGCQPKFIYEHEHKPGKVTFWFMKSETTYVYKKWCDSDPVLNRHEKELRKDI